MAVFRVPATLQWNGPGSPGVNVWSIRTTEGSVIIDELDSALTALANFYQAVSSVYPAGTTITFGPDIVEQDTQADQSRPQQQVSAAGSGTPDASVLQVVVGWRTSLRARRGMGRTFIGPLHSGMTDAQGTPNASLIETIQDAADALVAASEGAAGWAFGVWGLQAPGIYDSQGVLVPGQARVHRDFTNARVRDSYAVLRSRRD